MECARDKQKMTWFVLTRSLVLLGYLRLRSGSAILEPSNPK
jgi:hypothetical protein